MSIEARAIALFEEANPVPDIEQLTALDVEAAAYLATLEHRSSEMTKLETRPTEEESGRRPMIGWVAAAVAIVVIGVVAFLLTRGDDQSPVVTEPTETTIAGEATLEGYWEVDGGSTQLAVDGGTYWLVDGGSVVDTGEFRSGISLNFTSDADSPTCSEGMVATYDADWANDGQSFLTTLVSSDCATGLALDGRFTRTDPFEIPDVSDSSSGLEGNDPALIGTWRLGNMDIEFDGEEYVITSDGEVLDRGTYETGEGGSQATPDGSAITLISGEDSPSCEAGAERSVTYETYEASGERLGLETHEDGCPARLSAMLPWMDFDRR